MTETVKIEIYADNLSVTQLIASQLAQLVTAGTIILLEGNLGSGKTTFMQAFGLALGISATITSPTFTLIDEYIEGRLPLYHIDLYRLEPSQIPSLHLEEYWRGEDFPLGVVAIEWASKLLTMPPAHLKINLAATISSQNKDETKNLDLNLEDDLEVLSEARLIHLIAQGETYIDILTTLCAEAETKILVISNAKQHL
ncbi:tRNA (adenosine(37)-N6)-threonylcarbamoyltransferase complex ATPase subunit type 1 TsaE [Pseudanabaena sp. UWO311]|uniref:tRNA (adenosine(37)-N6)-threonylcarbamoyltransferase complex ATPase subunit type 1 TsaE n=1 Tax=Pseudanabaena sp. UWO311 TaxID=2487337 RepID=UPI0011583A5D|nr:tRNA (adenosine(37)-N6)-threonylcarbamoyltransferase complex ATPase subunit type 1 TsaE [Pseudanabaena sp. UWO311]TYQ28776.1 tRNA (adenosine(37)-N6)-threonylcarbamoyltransferase complex ATPase subunit type 1 TsaE [Pseudanabaena sp. UWO311]